MARATQHRMCPFKGGVCIESDCALFLGERDKGDCSFVYIAIRSRLQLDDVRESNHLAKLKEVLMKLDKRNKESINTQFKDLLESDLEKYCNK